MRPREYVSRDATDDLAHYVEENAICKSIGSDLWYEQTTDMQDLAKSICFECPVRKECLDLAFLYARSSYDHYGVWGGTNADWRRQHHDETHIVEVC